MPLNKVRTTQAQLQALFNAHYLAAFERGDITKTVKRSGTPSPDANQPPGTQSVIWILHNKSGQYIGVVHAYVLPNGQLSASGKPDPKELVIGGRRYVITKT